MVLGPAGLLVPVAQAQRPVIGAVEEMDFNRPESWAMKRASALLLFTAMGPPERREAGEVELSLEGIWNPELSRGESRVGFQGTKVEDMNRLPVIPRPRGSIGLGWDTVLDLAYIPPVEIDGVTPNIFAAALERPIYECGDFTLGLRIYGQVGEIEGDITCPEWETYFPPGSNLNPFACEYPSSDVITMNYAGLAVVGGYQLPGPVGGAIHFGAYATHMDLEFQVDALYSGIRDLNRQETDGWVYALTLGYSRPISEHLTLAVEGFYAPLQVMRGLPSGNYQKENDDLYNVRAMITCRF